MAWLDLTLNVTIFSEQGGYNPWPWYTQGHLCWVICCFILPYRFIQTRTDFPIIQQKIHLCCQRTKFPNQQASFHREKNEDSYLSQMLRSILMTPMLAQFQNNKVGGTSPFVACFALNSGTVHLLACKLPGQQVETSV